MLKFNGGKCNPRIAKIWELDLPVVKYDLRTRENRRCFYIGGESGYESNYEFENSAIEIEEVLLVGHVPATHVELLTGSDFPSGQIPAIF